MDTLKILILLTACIYAKDESDMDSSMIIGYYSWNWGTGSKGPANSTVGVAFAGYTDIPKAIAYYPPGAAWCCPVLKGDPNPWISIGGGNSAGVFDKASMEEMMETMDQIPNNNVSNYSGIVFDVEEVDGSSAVLIPLFQQLFSKAKGLNLTVVVTTSHSAPY